MRATWKPFERHGKLTRVSKAERDLAFANIKRAAKYYGIDLAD